MGYRDQEVVLDQFIPLIDYCLLLLKIVNWPNHWKKATLQKIAQSYTHIPTTVETNTPAREDELRYELRNHKMTIPTNLPPTQEASQEFFQKHQSLVKWMLDTEEDILRKYCDQVAGIAGGRVRPRGLI